MTKSRGLRGAALLLLLALAVWAMFRALVGLDELESGVEVDQFLLPLLSLALVVLTLGLAGILIRNLVKVIVERKRGILGAGLRAKLVFFFLALVLLPAIILFAGSAQVIKLTVEKILRAPAQLTRGHYMVDDWTGYLREVALREARGLGARIDSGRYLDRPASELAAFLESSRNERELAQALVHDRGRLLAAAPTGTGMFDPDPQVEATLLRPGPTGISQIVKADGLRVYASVPLSSGRHGEAPVLVVCSKISETIAENLEILDSADRDYRQLRTQRRELVRLYVTLLALIALATLFVATWIGFYVSRRITVPLQEISAATREISAGNLDVRVHTRVGDEMGLLVDSFNEMAGQLQENREVITHSTAELRHSNRALDERRRYIETLLASLSTGVVSLDRDGRVSTANPAVRSILGVDVRIGEEIRKTFSEHDLEPLNRLLDEAGQGADETLRRDMELPRGGTTLQLSIQLSDLAGQGGESLGKLMMFEDLTDLLRAQRALAWQEVARRIAHEIKNPLTPIQLAAQRMRKKFVSGAQDFGEVLLESTASIEREVGGLKQLVDEFSRFARMPEVSPRFTDLVQVIESVLALYQGLPEIRWDVEQDPAIGQARVDAQQLRRALINLIDNAVAAVEGRGTLRLETRAVGSTLRIEFSDSGPGIPPADRDRMFVPYFSTKARGTGLGLAIVHKIVTDHGGTIRVDDNEPSGARFVIELPALGQVSTTG